MGAFSTLSKTENPYGEKVIKFKQSRLKESLSSKLNAGDFELVKDGMCATYVLEWLRQSLGGGHSAGSSTFSRGADTKTEHNESNTKIAHATAPRYVMSSQLNAAFKDRANQILCGLAQSAYGLNVMNDPPAGWSKTIFELFLYELPGRPAGGGYYLRARTDAGGQHAIGWIKKEGSTHFFDPNIGEYRVINAAGFFERWYLQCESALRFTFSGPCDWINFGLPA